MEQNRTFLSCFFVDECSILINKMAEKMDRLEKIYEEFCVMMNEDRIYEDEAVSYADICRELCVEPSELDAVLLRELGFTGDELVEEYRKSVR